jgi:quinoprotein glucose dehydrogenase
MGAPRFSAEQIRTVIAAGKGRMPTFPHLTTTDVDALVALLTTTPAGRGQGAADARVVRGRSDSGAPRELIVGSGSASTRPDAPAGRGRGALPPYPDGVQQYERPVINEYNTVANRIAPPFTSIVKYDLNAPAIKWRVGFGTTRSWPRAASPAPGARPGQRRDRHRIRSAVRRRPRQPDSRVGYRHRPSVWSSRFGGDFVGSPVMYEMAGRQYLLVPAASTPPRGAGPGDAPLGWIAYALPRK